MTIFFADTGDNYDRLLLRLNDGSEAIRISLETCFVYCLVFNYVDFAYGVYVLKWLQFNSMELIIRAFVFLIEVYAREVV